MELKAYVEGILRSWWLLLLVAALAFWIGGAIGANQPSQYTASTTLLLNDKLLVTMLDPSNVVQLGTPASYQANVAPPAVLNRVMKAYPRLSNAQLQKDIVISTDATNQYLLISVTDIYPESAADIANFLAQHFVQVQAAELERQINYYINSMQNSVPQLNNEISELVQEIQRLTPPPTRAGPTPINPATQKAIAEDQFKLDRDQRLLYNDQHALTDLQNAQPLLKDAYTILQPASAANVLQTTSSLSSTTIRALAMAAGLAAAICLLIVKEYFHPCVRYNAELQRIVGLPTLAELPLLFNFEQKRLLQMRAPIFRRRIEPLRLLCAVIGAAIVKNKGHTILITSPRRKRCFAPILATLLAHNGHQTLLIDADSENPGLHRQIKLSAPSTIVTNQGVLLAGISKTEQPRLFVLPAASIQTSADLIGLLPQLQSTFSVIVINAPPIDHANTHLLTTKVAQTLVLVKKRRDSIKRLKATHDVCRKLKVDAQCLFLT